MDIFSSYTFNAPPERVWDLLMDPAAIQSCIPGCNKFEPAGDDRYDVTLTVGLAAITGTYDGTVVLTEKHVNTSYRLVVEGQGRAGFVKGSSVIALRAVGESTAVDTPAHRRAITELPFTNPARPCPSITRRYAVWSFLSVRTTVPL